MGRSDFANLEDWYDDDDLEDEEGPEELDFDDDPALEGWFDGEINPEEE